MNVPCPCISRLATSAFQWVTEPHPVHVCTFTPARPNAGGMSVAALLPFGWNGLPSSSRVASNLPGPQLRKTVRTSARHNVKSADSIRLSGPALQLLPRCNASIYKERP